MKGLRYLAYVGIALASQQVLAGEFIKITVKTYDPNVAAIGYSVDGIDSGGLGSSYTGLGPKDKQYSFGYRNTIFGENINCGSAVLNKNCTVVLVYQNNVCTYIIK